MQFSEQRKVTSTEDLINDIDLVFRHVDSVFLINISCGESFLKKDLSEFVKYTYDRYFERYGFIVILTNGTIVPSDKEMSTLAGTNVVISISEYSDEKTKTSLETLVSKCEQYKIDYYLNTSSDKGTWFDFGNPYVITETQPEKLKARYKRCFKCGNSVTEGNIYICQKQNAAWAVAGIPQFEAGDFFDLSQPKTEQSKQELYKIIAREPDRGYVEHCKRCYGTIPISERGK